MASYLDQYTRFSQGQAQLARSGSSSFAQGAAYAANNSRARRQAEANAQRRQIEAQAKEKRDVDKLLYGQAFSEMADWMVADLKAEQAYYDQQFESGNADAIQMTTNVANLKAGTKQYQNAWGQYEGKPDDNPLQGTRYGMLNALEQMELDKNPWSEADQAPVDDYATLVGQTSERYAVLQKGKAELEQYIMGGMDEATGKWMLTFGDPTDPDTWTKVDRGTLVANLEAGNAYAPRNGFKDINIPTIRELSAENQAKSFVGDDPEGAATYYRTMITGTGPAHKRFKKAVFDEMAPDFLTEEELKEQRSLFTGDGLIDIQFNRGENKLNYNNVDPRIERLVSAGLNRFTEGYGEANRPKASSEDKYPNENKIRISSWDAGQAANLYPKSRAQRGMEMLGLPVPEGFKKDTLEPIKNISDMVAIRPFDMDPGSGKMIQAIAQDADGKLIAKVTQEVQPTLSEQQILAGITVDQVPTQEVTFYEMVPDALIPNVYKEIGLARNPKSSNPVGDGQEYLFNKYISPFNEEPKQDGIEEITIDTPPPAGDSPSLPGSPLEDRPVPKYYDPQDTLGRAALQMKLMNAMPSEMDALEMFKWLEENPGQIDAIVKEIDKGNYPTWFAKDAFSPVELVFEKQE
tara:strand:- start:452 stop:2350 length:1899 start_codon:yes stop_codon:yes gene_type:complete